MVNNKYKRLRAFINFIYEIEPDIPERLLSGMHFVKKPVKTFTISDAYFDRIKKFYNECKEDKTLYWFIPIREVLFETGTRVFFK